MANERPPQVVGPDDLKLGILRYLIQTGQHEHKMNLLGRPGQPGRLEWLLKTTFSPAQRAVADRCFEELKGAGLIQPTYRDLVSPQEWVEITAQGREALERNSLDALDAALALIDPRLIEIRRGGWSALASGQPDSIRQAAHSGRELIEQVLEHLAPDEEIRAQPGFRADPGSRSGITRRMRLRHAMRKKRGEISDADVEIAESAADLVLAVVGKLMALAHARADIDAEDARAALQAAELAVSRVLIQARAT